MSDCEPDVVLGPFSSPDAQATPWASALAVVGAAEVFWLSTVRPDGRPHVTPLLAAWSLGGLCFTTGDRERKALLVPTTVGDQVSRSPGVTSIRCAPTRSGYPRRTSESPKPIHFVPTYMGESR
ncbi:pyridoxamine 5'-phosphate oxidase family protein [Nocardia sp. NPDC050408]|uniref:pyridoxamine 5'-phosphate oxidase family protein n=1 Tax=unclassified Nocardia TaxID=2637762 RepID=UPI003439C34F